MSEPSAPSLEAMSPAELKKLARQALRMADKKLSTSQFDLKKAPQIQQLAKEIRSVSKDLKLPAHTVLQAVLPRVCRGYSMEEIQGRQKPGPRPKADAALASVSKSAKKAVASSAVPTKDKT